MIAAEAIGDFRRSEGGVASGMEEPVAVCADDEYAVDGSGDLIVAALREGVEVVALENLVPDLGIEGCGIEVAEFASAVGTPLGFSDEARVAHE